MSPAPTVRDIAANAATPSSGTGVFRYDGVEYLDCVGEMVRTVIHAPYTYHLTVNAHGEYVYVERFDQHAIAGYLVGQTSGHHWTRVDNVSPFVDRSTGGGGSLWTARMRFVSETAPTIELRAVFHMLWDASGQLRADKLQQKCWLR